LLKKYGSINMFESADNSTAPEGRHDCTRDPLVSRTANHFQHDVLMVTLAEQQNRAIRVDATVNRDAPSARCLADSALQIE